MKIQMVLDNLESDLRQINYRTPPRLSKCLVKYKYESKAISVSRKMIGDEVVTISGKKQIAK